MEWKDDIDETQGKNNENDQTRRDTRNETEQLTRLQYIMYLICILWVCIGIFGSIGERCNPVTLLNPLYWISTGVICIYTYRSHYMVNTDTLKCETSNHNTNTPFSDVLLSKISLLLSLLFFSAFIYKVIIVNVALHNVNICQASREINKLYHVFIFYVLSEIVHFISFLNKNAYPALFTSNILWLVMIFIICSLLLYLFQHPIQSIYSRNMNILFTLPLSCTLLYSILRSVNQIISGKHEIYKGLYSLPSYFNNIHEKIDGIRSCTEFGSFSQLFENNNGEVYVQYLGIPIFYTYMYILYETQFM
jgi:hypothetical protein